MGNSCAKVPRKKLVNKREPPQYSSVSKGDLNIYNRFAITDYREKWIVSTNIIYASKKSLVYPCAKIKKGCCYSKLRYDCVLKVADYSQSEITCLGNLPNLSINSKLKSSMSFFDFDGPSDRDEYTNKLKNCRVGFHGGTRWAMSSLIDSSNAEE